MPAGIGYGNKNVDSDSGAMYVSGVPRSAFDVSYHHKTTFGSGVLVPLYVDEVLPGDSFRVKMTAFARLAACIVPVMDNIWLESFWFFVPNRLLWDNWQRFMGERLNPSDTTNFLVPQVTMTPATLAFPGIGDWFGITNHGSGANIVVNSLPFRAYNLIWNEWFRDQDLQVPAVVTTGDGPDTATDYIVRSRNKRPDYFTTCRPWPQKPTNQLVFNMNPGAPMIPGQNEAFGQALSSLYGVGAPVSGLGVVSGATSSAGSAPVVQPGGRVASFGAGGLGVGHFTTTDDPFFMVAANGGLTPDVRVMINDIRTASAVERLLEKNARGGTRYTELVFEHFRVRSPDSRWQRPEYLGGGRTRVTVNPVAQTSATGLTGGSTPQAFLTGTASVVAEHGFSQSFTEHGWVMGVVEVHGDKAYQDGTNRMWFRRTTFDFYWPSLANLGEQAVLSREIFSDGSGGDLDVFGYQERYGEYRYKPSMISGAMRSTTATPLDMWHLAETYASRAAASLTSSWMFDQTPLARLLATGAYDSQQLLCDALFDIRYTRPMPVRSLPGVGIRL